MALPLKKQNSTYYYEQYSERIEYVSVPKKSLKRPKKKKKSLMVFLLAWMLVIIYGACVCPHNYNTYFRPLFLNRILNRNLKIDTKPLTFPTQSYIHNSYMIDRFVLAPRSENKYFADINITSEMTDTKQKLLELFKKYPKLEPSVYVWEYSKARGFEINSDTVYPSASIIKIPIAFELMRKLDETSKSQNPLSLNNEMEFNQIFRTDGSGFLKNSPSHKFYSLDYLASIMIGHSDNSATNMLLYQIGGMDGFNRAMRNLGLKVTSMGEWLPDLSGKNKITAHEVSRLLYNIDNPKIINSKYNAILKEYLGNVKNTHLLKEKLPQGVMVLHKTGDIGEMLGDSGIVYTNSGKKYIVTILVKRPHNSYAAKTLIQDASLIIYNDIEKLF